MKNQIKDKYIFIALITFFSLMIIFGFVADRFDNSKLFLAQLSSPTSTSIPENSKDVSNKNLDAVPPIPPAEDPNILSAPTAKDFNIPSAPVIENPNVTSTSVKKDSNVTAVPVIENLNATPTSPADYRALPGHKIKKLSLGLKVVSGNDFTTDLTINPQSQAQYAVIKNSAGKIIGKLYVNFSSAIDDIDFSGITAEINISAKKSVMHKVSWPVSVSVSKTLYIPSTGVGEVYICPGAASINEVNPICPNKTTIQVGKTVDGISVNAVEIQEQNYYEVSGITGTGGQESNPILPNSLKNSDNDTGMVYTAVDELAPGESIYMTKHGDYDITGKSSSPTNPAWIQTGYQRYYSPNSFDTVVFGSDTPFGIATVDGTEFWITDYQDDKVYHVTSAGVLIDQFSTAIFGSDFPTSITTVDGTEFWITDAVDDEVYHVTSSGVLISQFDTAGFGSDNAFGITTVDGTKFWISDHTDAEIYHVTSSGVLISQFDTASFGSTYPVGITKNGIDFWIVDTLDAEVYHTNSTGVLIDQFDTAAFGSNFPAGIATVDGTEFWITDYEDDEVYHVTPLVPTGATINNITFYWGHKDMANWRLTTQDPYAGIVWSPNGTSTFYNVTDYTISTADKDESYILTTNLPTAEQLNNGIYVRFIGYDSNGGAEDDLLLDYSYFTVNYSIPAVTSTFTQNFFRFYVNNDALDPTDPWPVGSADLGENSGITSSDNPPASGEVLRIRMSIQVGSVNLSATSSAFKLQFAERVTTCSAISSWTDLGALGSGIIWRGFNAAPVDGVALSGNPPTAGDLNLTVSDRAGTYEEANNTALNPFAVLVGEDVEYDWVIQDNGALNGTNYCFRMTKADGTALNSYNYYPALITVGFRPKSQNWRWYDDETNETPIAPLAAENVAPADIVNQNIVKLRLTIKETANVAGTDIKFKLQFSESSDFSSGVNDVVEIGNCATNSLWCYGNGVDSDNSSITALVLTDSTLAGIHNESGTSASTFDPPANTAVEYEFTIKHAGARANRTYFFRAFDTVNNKAVPLNSGETFPSLSTQGGTLTFSIGGLAAGTLIEGITTDVAASPTGITFGTLGFNSETEAAQRLTATTNATEGYQIFMFQRQGLLSSGSSEITPVIGTNESPTSWTVGCVSAGCYGYHAGDDTLAGASTRFAPNDTYAKLETIAKEVAFNSGPVTNESTDIVFKTQITNQQDAGNYLSSIVYILVPTF